VFSNRQMAGPWDAPRRSTAAGPPRGPVKSILDWRLTMSPFDWTIFLRILLAILRILQDLPPEADTTAVARGLADAVDLQVNGGGADT